jgi:8-oxo-dGTP pyrophosphatase MutT (NUDIX family)
MHAGPGDAEGCRIAAARELYEETGMDFRDRLYAEGCILVYPDLGYVTGLHAGYSLYAEPNPKPATSNLATLIHDPCPNILNLNPRPPIPTL